MFRGVCVDAGWGPGGFGSPDPAMLADLGIRRVRVISRVGIEWYVEQCWSNNILVRAVVVDGYYCPADEYLVLNEPNLHGMPPAQFASELQIHRHQYPDLTLIAGALGDAPDIGIDAAAYMRAVIAAGGLDGYGAVAINYPASAARMTAFKKAVGTRAIHVPEYNVEPGALSDYLATVIYPYARTADLFCISDGMRDDGWTKDFGLFNVDGTPKPLLRHWLSLAR